MVKRRIQIIKETVANLKKIKQDGIDITRDYSPNDLLYDRKFKKFGRIGQSTKYYFSVKYEEDLVVYFRKSGWKPCKEQFLIDHYRDMTNRDLSKTLNCSEKIIEKKLSKLNLKRNFEWDEDKDKFLINNIQKSNKWLAEQLNTTLSSIKGRIYRLKAKGVIPSNKKRVVYTWTDEDDKFLIRHLEQSNQWLADHFGLKVSSVKSRLRKLREIGLVKTHRKRGKKKQDSAATKKAH